MVRFLFVFSVFLVSAFSSPAFAELGFLESLFSNDVVQSKKDSIYKIYVPAPPIYKIPAKELVKFNSAALALPKKIDGNDEEQISKLLLKRQVEHCLKTPDRDCLLYGSSIRGSIFFSGDAKTAYTAYHNVEGLVQGQFQKYLGERKQSLIRNELAAGSRVTGDVKDVDPKDVPTLMSFYKDSRIKSVPIIILNTKNEIVYGEQSNDNYDSMDYRPEQVYSIYGVDIQRGFNDFARIKLNKSIGHVLAVATEESHGDRRYLLGFPMQQDRSYANKPSSLGDRMYFSQGEAQNTYNLKERTGANLKTDDAENERVLRQIAYCDCDGAPGLSGGAAVNDSGEAVFVISQVLPLKYDQATEDNIISFGPRMTHVLRELSELDAYLKK